MAKMSKKTQKDPAVVQPIWDDQQVKKITQWLKSDAGIKHIESIPSRNSETTDSFNEMIIINPDQLREPYTI